MFINLYISGFLWYEFPVEKNGVLSGLFYNGKGYDEEIVE